MERAAEQAGGSLKMKKPRRVQDARAWGSNVNKELNVMKKITTSAKNVTPATVNFHGHALTVITDQDGARLVAMKPICEAIGLGWQSQHKRIQRHPVLAATVAMMTMVAEDGKDRELTCLPLDMLNGWLFGVDASRVKPEIRETLVQYQRECYGALAAYWQQGEAVNPRKVRKPKALPGGLQIEQQEAIKAMVKGRIEALPQNKQAKAAITCWSALKSKFGCTYKEIATEQFTEAVSLLARLPLEGEWLPSDERNPHALAPTKPQIDLLPAAQAKEITDRLRRLSLLFHPFSEQFVDVLGIDRALRGLHPRAGLPEAGYLQALPRIY